MTLSEDYENLSCGLYIVNNTENCSICFKNNASILFIRLFNLVSQYGQVRKIIFTKSGGLEVDQCRVVMTSSKGAAELQKNLFNQELFGEIIQASLGVLVEEDENPVMFELEDGSRSWKNFVMDGAPWPETCFPPSKVELDGY